jgi:hypothetical protein
MRKIYSSLILLFLSISCHQNKEVSKVIKESNSKPIKIVAERKLDTTYETYPLVIDTLKIGLQKFIVIQKDPRNDDDNEMNLTILNSQKDTIYVHDTYATNGFNFEDFDNNGILDIRLEQITNVGGVSELIFYDKDKKIFKAVEDFSNYPNPIKVKNTKYWYSYHRSGCADINWGSELFKIENFKVIKIGEIEGIGCEEEKENGIFIYKTKGDSRKRILSEKREPGYYADKWDYIENYWNKNFKKFE